MSLRLWTVTIVLAGLALYTLSLLPEVGSKPAGLRAPESGNASSDLPGASVYPLIYRDPDLIQYCPYGDNWNPLPHADPSISLPEQVSLDPRLPAHPIILSVSQEV